MNRPYYNSIFWLKFPRYDCSNSALTKKDYFRFLIVSTLHILLFLFVGTPIQLVSGIYILLGLIELYIRKSTLSRVKIQRYTATLLILLSFIVVTIPILSVIGELIMLK